MRIDVYFEKESACGGSMYEATSEEEALDKAMEADNSEWQSETDVDWQITRVEESE